VDPDARARDRQPSLRFVACGRHDELDVEPRGERFQQVKRAQVATGRQRPRQLARDGEE
jgi:hypothetical protein